VPRVTDATAPEFRRRRLEEYGLGLQRLGYRHVPPPRLVCRPDGRPLYFMVFAADHGAGVQIMEAAFNRVQPATRETTFLPHHQRY
jgi:hypothetical protein